MNTVTDNRAAWDAYMRHVQELRRVRVEVGILSGQPRYAPGHVGRKSRTNDTRNNADRFSEMGGRRSRSRFTNRGAIKALRASIGNRDAIKKYGDAYQRRIAKAAGSANLFNYGGKARNFAEERFKFLKGKALRGTAVAKVAAVLGYPVIWRKTIAESGEKISGYVEGALRQMAEGRSGLGAVHALGRYLVNDFRGDIAKDGHVDTGLLKNTVSYKLIDEVNEATAKAEKMIMRAARKKIRDARYRAKRRAR